MDRFVSNVLKRNREEAEATFRNLEMKNAQGVYRHFTSGVFANPVDDNDPIEYAEVLKKTRETMSYIARRLWDRFVDRAREHDSLDLGIEYLYEIYLIEHLSTIYMHKGASRYSSESLERAFDAFESGNYVDDIRDIESGRRSKRFRWGADSR